uniref:ENTH domain-containing protein n=1 Tax=Musa acuminata subsp. malaccensis TaxID=214687 RepID=A0A804KM44_MUSAM|nr:PREDICTED: clathrin interactor EPSIN 2-like isoform X3 [Musa acuminata subsp. malaccensis]
MKKVFGQTVRDLKREVNKKVLKVPNIEQKILDATSNESWGPHGSLLADIAQATRNYHEYQMIMNVIWKRINDTGKNWRHVYKALTVLEYLVAHGSERVIDEIREHVYQISTLSDFQYIDSSGRDQGNNVRRKSQSLVVLVNDKERIYELRQKGAASRDKYRGAGSTGRPGGYSDHCEDDRYESRNASRDEDRYGNGKEREWGYKDDDRYNRDRDSYGREGDRSSVYSDEHHGRDGFRDDDSRGGHGNDDYQDGSRNRSIDDDDRYSSRSGGGRSDSVPPEERQLERRPSEQSISAPPSYEEATRDAQTNMQEASPIVRNGDEFVATAPRASSPHAPKPSSPSESTTQGSPFAPTDGSPLKSTIQGLGHAPVGASASANNTDKNVFEDFDPRGSVSVGPPAASSLEMDLFGSASALDSIYSLDMMPLPTATNGTGVDLPTNSDLGADFMVMSSGAMSQHGENPFGDLPFIAIHENSSNQLESFAHVTSFNSSISTGGAEIFPPEASEIQTATDFDFDAAFGVTCNPPLDGQQSSYGSPAILTQEAPLTPASNDISGMLATQTGSAALNPMQEAQPAAPADAQQNIIPQSGPQAPFALQTTHFPAQDARPITPTNNHAAQARDDISGVFATQTGLAAYIPMQEAQPVAPTHGQGNLIPQSGSPAPFMLEAARPITPTHGQGNLIPQSGPPAPFMSEAARPIAPINNQSTQLSEAAYPIAQINNQSMQLNLPSQPGPQAPTALEVTPAPSALPPIRTAESKEKFEPKSAVWADTLSRGLVNLNISGPKINPHADIGIDFDSMNRKEKRREDKKVSTAPVSITTMGKAMGSGSGIGRAGASSLAVPPNPMMGNGMGMGMGGMGMMGGAGMGMGMMGGSGMGMGMMGGAGMGMGMGMGMGGYGGSMNQPMGMGMNMGMNQGMMPQRPPMGGPLGGNGIPGAGYNPMMGMGNYGSQQPYGGGGGGGYSR